MNDLTLVILAAGMGSRYGGLKQIDKFGISGETIIDFSIYDAIQAGFNKLVLIIRKEHEEIFEKELVSKIRPHIDVEYAFQDLKDIPEGFELDDAREKPLGTTHALLSTRDIVKTPFAICNADDYYGKEAFVKMSEYLKTIKSGEAAMVGYILNKTLTNHGTVTRGICENKEGLLTKIVETEDIRRSKDGIIFGDNNEPLDDNTLCSMNFWGFNQEIFKLMEEKFVAFLEEELQIDPLKKEALLPKDVGTLIDEQKLKVHVLKTNENWFGVTYKEDKENVMKTFEKFQTTGVYPEKLWK